MKKEGNRLLALEGLRGIAAIVVVIHHATLVFYASLILGPAIPQNIFFEHAVYGSVVSFLFSGTFAVGIFFVLSGFVLSIGFFQTGDSKIVKKLAAKRYLRLMIPALVSVLLAWFLLTLGYSHTQAAATYTQSPWLNAMWNFIPSLASALQEGSWGAFFNNESSYNPVLWTMTYEFSGSFIVFATLLLAGKLQKRWIVYIFLAIATYRTWFLGFIVGMILADMYSNDVALFKKTGSSSWAWAALVVGLILGGYPLATTANTIFNSVLVQGLTPTQNLSFFIVLGASLVVIAVLKLPILSKFLSLKYVATLGKYTYSLYLIHKLVLFTLCTGLFLWFRTFMGYNSSVLWAVVLSIPVILLVTYFFEKYVDSPAIRFSGVFANWFLGLPQREGAEAYTKEPGISLWSRVRNRVRSARKPVLMTKRERLESEAP